ncbi:hypothetical protein AGMMS49983_02650 [Clostridia bacterium]|nr:hypothetical protein AGMMS49983_02650 [Clostridia bacterium]
MVADFITTEYAGRYATIDQIVDAIAAAKKKISRSTVIWNVNELIKQDKAIRVGRGVYEFRYKPYFEMKLTEDAETVRELLLKDFKYMKATVTDTVSLSQFMNLQPFSTTVVIEVRKKAVDSVLTMLRRSNLAACSKKDFDVFEKYANSTVPVIVCPEYSANPSLIENNGIRIANIEKILVDLVCDKRIYGQYQGEELNNIFMGATKKYRVNYSQLLKYAALRKRKADVIFCLNQCDEYREIKGLL